MPDDQPVRFACPKCGKGYRWKAELGGHKVRCRKCGFKMRVPATAGDPVEPLDPLPGDSDAGKESVASYELDLSNQEQDQEPPGKAMGKKSESQDDTDPPPTTKPPPSESRSSESRSSEGTSVAKCPACNSRIKAGAVICINCGYNLKTGETLETHVDTSPEEGEEKEEEEAG